jgi:hypothetical protein
MFVVFYTNTGANIAMFANEVYARRFTISMRAQGHSVDYDIASQNQAEQFVRDMF